MLRMHGLKKPEDGVPKNQPLECPICKTINEFTNSFCKNCGKALTLKVAMDTEEQINRETNKAFELLREIAKSPELLKEFEKFRKQF
jgi:predicted amidophosphoribosyltransferase